MGELVTETFEYDGGRQVTVYLPPAPPEAVVFGGDGQLISRWGAQLEAADVPPTMIVGAFRTADEDEMVRVQEYSPSFDPERFAAHERFFVEDVRSWVRSSPRRRAPAIGRRPSCRARYRGSTWSPAHWSRSSPRTRPGGRTRCAMPVRRS
jgi:hypothetical protein